ncbi:DNA/RNA non-specific endonuclease [uncultured Clostridium sp.]|uniref:DNA/RNA non-specific endonuclease n=1 Tax=uncultured Clostridium sp. TaxID=59620 RepID=UPI00321672A5
MKKFLSSLIGILFAVLIIGMNMMPEDTNNQRNVASNKIEAKEEKEIEDTSIDESIEADKETASNLKEESKKETSTVITEDIFSGYKLIVVDGGNISGYREPNVVVDIGFGDREYYAFTNEYGQLVKVIAKEIILQDDSTEPVNSSGRYYQDEAKVPGVESKTLDEGHVIADSLGGVSNAYNITPQNSILNRHGDQAYMEKVIRDAGGCTEFVAIITYPDTTTQIPSHYSYTYTINGNVINDEFDNVNPDEYNASLETNTSSNNSNSSSNTNTTINNSGSTSSPGKVYWTPNGKSYHTTKSCSTLSRSKTILEGTIQESGKNDPCDRCH